MRSISLCAMLAALLAVCGSRCRAGVCYEAMGYLTYTSFDASGSPTYKNVMMFDVKVRTNEWHIRTEPVVEGRGGVGFYEESGGTNDFVLRVTALKSAYNMSASSFEALRAELKATKKDDVYFANAPTRIPATFLNRRQPPDASSRKAIPAERAATNRADNVAVAVALKGKYPVVDPSCAAFLWFAFTPPTSQSDGASKMLLQTWDDGNPTRNRFRRASWSQFAEFPHLVSSAVYNWLGKELLPDGTLASLNTSDVSKPLDVAARYDVDAATNYGGLKLPLSFKLMRFHTKRSDNREPNVVSTTVGSVVKVSRLPADVVLDVTVPGKTFVSDYRLSAGELKGTPIGYLLLSNHPPDVDQLKQRNLYKHALREVTAAAPSPHLRWIVVAFLLIPSGVVVLFWRQLTRRD